MAQALTTTALGLAEAAAHLAGLLRRLHALPPWPGSPAGSAVLHLDLHPENVLMTARGPVVVDWCNARPGEPDLDTGLTALIVAQVAVEHGHEWSAAAGELLAAFVPRAPGDPIRLLDDVVRFRRRQLDTLTPAELGLIDLAAERMRACVR
jgi:Ser/Thr protein kinase RdoA (MazF antagonist)